PAVLRARLDRALAERLRPACLTDERGVKVEAWVAPAPRLALSEVRSEEFSPFVPPTWWGAPWATTWFHVTAEIPDGWRTAPDDVEIRLDLGFRDAEPGFQAEALVFAPDGTIVKAIQSRNDWIPASEGPTADFWLEAASNPTFLERRDWRRSALGDPATLTAEPLYEFRSARLVLRNREVERLVAELCLVRDLMDATAPETARGRELAGALERSLLAVATPDVAGAAPDARAALAGVLARRAADSAQTGHAVAHAHIDSAWLWPRQETIRKCARTFANMLHLMDVRDDLVFTCSQVQQYAWMKEHYPQLYVRIKERVAEGRWYPAGGMWVEPDALLTGGESLARQFLEAERFLAEEFGVSTDEVWLPDSFGYSGALPQIARLAGKARVFTQKLSWNETNRMPSTSFDWEGIDGTRLFTHFSPTDTYNAEVSVAEALLSERQFTEGDRAKHWLMPFGYGDGGGGPTREMLDAAGRMGDLEGLPRIELSRPDRFFATAESELTDRDVWTGEMYLEKHRGTYTSQHHTKQGNRRGESTLREAEAWSVLATLRAGVPYPHDELRELWRTLLYNQFHDILPGSSIAWVHADAEADHAALIARAEALIADRMPALTGVGPAATVHPVVRPLADEPDAGAVECDDSAGFVLDNGLLRIQVDASGHLTGFRTPAGPNLVAPDRAWGRLEQLVDIPNNYDAWDIDAYTLSTSTALEPTGVRCEGDERERRIVVSYRWGSSSAEVAFVVGAGRRCLGIAVHVDWHEDQQLLKLALPLAMHATTAECGVQFGFVTRPLNANTSWERSRFEVPALRWLRLPEGRRGVAIASDSTYGWDFARTRDSGGGGATTARTSLLRSPRIPDPTCDQGVHDFRFEVMPDADLADAVALGLALDNPPRTAPGPIEPLLVPDEANTAFIECVKLADDRSGDVIVRAYESLGERGELALTPSFAFASVSRVDLLERPLAGVAAPAVAGGSVRVRLRPFEIVTLRFGASSAA
ncbi:MAG: glycosyl hydrolase-related protein, partial [Propionibacteriaceae bacterium]|nr:glycosyl hydrolase-related protein [Propionibacteriaceae bacterium]